MAAEKLFYNFTQELIQLLDKLDKEHASLKTAWFRLNQFYLSFAGKCDDPALRGEAFKLIKELSSEIPLRAESDSNGLEKPFDQTLDIDKLIDKVRTGRKLNPSDIK